VDLVDDDVRDVRQRREVELGVDLVLFCPSLASSPPAEMAAEVVLAEVSKAVRRLSTKAITCGNVSPTCEF
jgi:hypothetical protein